MRATSAERVVSPTIGGVALAARAVTGPDKAWRTIAGETCESAALAGMPAETSWLPMNVDRKEKRPAWAVSENDTVSPTMVSKAAVPMVRRLNVENAGFFEFSVWVRGISEGSFGPS